MRWPTPRTWRDLLEALVLGVVGGLVAGIAIALVACAGYRVFRSDSAPAASGQIEVAPAAPIEPGAYTGRLLHADGTLVEPPSYSTNLPSLELP